MRKRILSILTALALCLGLLPAWAWAAETGESPVLDIADGNILISDGKYAQVKKDGANPDEWQSYSGEITITGTSASWYHIKITGGTHTIRLKNASIAPKITQDTYRSGQSALNITGSTVRLILEGTSTLTGSSSYVDESIGYESVYLENSTLNIEGNGTLNVKGGQSLRQAEASSPQGGNGIICSRSTICVSASAALNVNGGNMNLRDTYWGNGIYALNSSLIELSGGTARVKGMAGLDLRNARLSQTGGTLSVEGRSGIDSTDSGYQAEVSGGVMEVHGSSLPSISRGSLAVSGGEVTLRTDYYQTAVGASASVTVKPAAGYCGIMKHGGSADSAAKTPFAEETTLSSVSGKYVNITFSNEKHSLAVQGGGTGASGSGTYLPGQKVDIRAGTVKGKDFKWWEAASGDGSFADAGAADTTFTMGWEDAVIQPVFVTGKVEGDFVVATEDESGYTYADGVLTISGSGTYAISMKNPGTATSNRIVLEGSSPMVILDGVQINSGKESAIQVAYSNKRVNATLKLSGVNKLSTTQQGWAAVGVWTQNPTYYSVSLTITSLAGDGSTDGRLEATGDNGIGASGSQGSGNITINGGTIVATGNGNNFNAGYGIGRDSRDSKTVTINGGDVTAAGTASAKRAFGGSLVLNNDPSIVVNGKFVHQVNNDQSVHIYYDDKGGSSVKSVAVTPQGGEVFAGNTLQFEAQVEGGANADKTVAWSVEGASSAGTAIDENGLLTVGQDETAGSLTVTAANTYSGKSASAQATVKKKLAPPAPTGLAWQDGAASWTAADGADHYSVQLYKDETPVGGAVFAAGTTYTFPISEAGSYTFGVKSVGADGTESEEAVSGSLSFFSVAFDTDGGGEIAAQTVPAGGRAAKPQDPQKAGYTFAGWYSDSGFAAPWDFDTGTVTQDMTLYAKWEAESYTVTVETDGNGSASASAASAAAGTEITLTAAPDSGYHFKEWQVVSGSAVISGGSFTMPAENVTIKAVFERDETPPEHVHQWDSAWSGDDTYHWHECLAGGCGVTADSGKRGYAAHVYDNAQDADCNVCGHIREVKPPKPGHVHDWDSEWSGDDTHHWHECLAGGCGVTADSGKRGYAAHVYDNAQDADCNVCGHIREVKPPKPGHIHDWDSEWSGDDTYHWHECLAGGCGVTADSGKDGYAIHVYDDEQDTTCNICGLIREVTPPEPGDEETKIEITEGITDVPPALAGLEHLNTPQKLAQAMRAAITQSGVPSANTAVYDVRLLVSTDGGATWTQAAKDNFPAGGLTVTLPYPGGTDGSYRFTVVHMFTTSDFGKTPGDTETPPVTNTADGLRFTVTGLSPISVGWQEKEAPVSPTPSRPSGGGSSVRTYSVTVEKSEHGTVTVNRTSAASGTTVTLTVTPDTGYVLLDLAVTDSQGNQINLTDKNTFIMPGRYVTVKASFAPLPDESQEKLCDGGAGCPSRVFTDLGAVETWYHEAVDYVLRNNLMGGYGNGLFGPDNRLTRAQFVQILCNHAGRPSASGSGFKDVPANMWCYNAISWAASQGIAGGYDGGVFGPNDPITREQLAVMLWRYAGSPVASDKELYFTDADKASGYALDALRWAVENGVMGNYGNGQVSLQGLATRAEAAQMLKNYLER